MCIVHDIMPLAITAMTPYKISQILGVGGRFNPPSHLNYHSYMACMAAANHEQYHILSMWSNALNCHKSEIYMPINN